MRCQWESFKIEHIYDTTADFRRSKTNLLMCLQWYINLVTACSRQLWTILKFIIVVLRSEIPSGMCAKLRTVAASNNRVHMLAISLTIACSRYMYNGVVLHAHPVRGESHNERNTPGEVATVDYLAAKKSGILNWCRYFCDRSISSGSILKVTPSIPGHVQYT